MRTFLVYTILVFCYLAIGCGVAYKVPTESMLPTIKISDTCIANPFAYLSNSVERFDLVVFKAPEDVKLLHNLNGNVSYIKRVIGLPNEKFEIKDNKIYINDRLLDESFDKIVSEKDFRKNFSAVIIPSDEYFLLGDNRPDSEDSRYYKNVTINKKDIVGKIVQIVHKDE